MTVITGEENVQKFRLLTLRTGLALETKGLTKSKPTCYQVVKKEFALTGDKETVLRKFEDILEDRGLLSKERRKTERS